MSDGVVLNANTSTGVTALTDDTGATGHAQVVKLAISTNGSPTLIPADGTDGLLVNLGSNNDVTVTSGSITADTELPAAAALADNTANPTTPSVGVFPHWYDGSTWDRARGDSTDGLLVNLGTNNDVVVTNAGTFAVQDATAQASLSVIDDWDESDRAKVNPIVGQAGVQGGAGTVTANTVRVAMASDSSLPVSNTGTFVVQENGAALTALQLLDNASVNHDDAAVAGVIQWGLNARTSDGTPVGNADAVRAMSDTLGKQVMLIGAPLDLHVRGGTQKYTGTARATILQAQGASQRVAIMSMTVTNANASTGTRFEISDSTGVLYAGFAAAAGGGFAPNGGGVPLFIAAANTHIVGKAETTGAEIDVNLSGFKLTN